MLSQELKVNIKAKVTMDLVEATHVFIINSKNAPGVHDNEIYKINTNYNDILINDDDNQLNSSFVISDYVPIQIVIS